MKVILYDHVKGVGRQGDLVNVSEGYFRNFLKPKNLAEEATPAALKRYEKMQKKAVELAAQKVADAEELAAKIKDIQFEVKAKAGSGDKLFGAVTTADIAKALEDGGFTIDKKAIETPEPIKTLGLHKAHLKIHTEVTAEITVNVVRIEK